MTGLNAIKGFDSPELQEDIIDEIIGSLEQIPVKLELIKFLKYFVSIPQWNPGLIEQQLLKLLNSAESEEVLSLTKLALQDLFNSHGLIDLFLRIKPEIDKLGFQDPVLVETIRNIYQASPRSYALGVINSNLRDYRMELVKKYDYLLKFQGLSKDQIQTYLNDHWKEFTR